MGKRIEYSYGEILNKETGSRYLEERPPHKKMRWALIQCGECGKPYEGEIKAAKNGHYCKKCGLKHRINTQTQKYKTGDILSVKTATTYVSEDKTINGKRYVIAECGQCHEHYSVRLDIVKAGHFCEKCKAQNHRKYHEGDIITSKEGLRFLFKEELKSDSKVRKGTFCIVDNNNNPIGEDFIAIPAQVVSGYAKGCKSFAEKKMYSVLSSLEIPFQEQYHFDDLKGKKGYLFFDFLVKYYNKNYLIELDGEQHFRVVPSWGGKEGYEQRVLYDNLKNEYVEKLSDYTLIRIPYTDFENISCDYVLSLLERGEE